MPQERHAASYEIPNLRRLQGGNQVKGPIPQIWCSLRFTEFAFAAVAAGLSEGRFSACRPGPAPPLRGSRTARAALGLFNSFFTYSPYDIVCYHSFMAIQTTEALARKAHSLQARLSKQRARLIAAAHQNGRIRIRTGSSSFAFSAGANFGAAIFGRPRSSIRGKSAEGMTSFHFQLTPVSRGSEFTNRLSGRAKTKADGTTTSAASHQIYIEREQAVETIAKDDCNLKLRSTNTAWRLDLTRPANFYRPTIQVTPHQPRLISTVMALSKVAHHSVTSPEQSKIALPSGAASKKPNVIPPSTRSRSMPLSIPSSGKSSKATTRRLNFLKRSFRRHRPKSSKIISAKKTPLKYTNISSIIGRSRKKTPNQSASCQGVGAASRTAWSLTSRQT